MKKLAFILALTLAIEAQAQTLPTLPQATVDTTYTLPTGGTTFTPANSAAFATALTNAVLGDVIVLTAGTTYTGPFTLPNKTTGSGWIYITSSAYSSLPAPGVRVSPSNASNMPTIAGTSAGVTAINTANTAHHYRFVGVQIQPAAGQFVFTLVDLGNADTSTTTMPHHIVFDRCYVHGDPSVGGRRGVAMNGPYIGVVDSYFSDFKENGGDTQAVHTYNSPGPLKIYNNYLEASGENFMSGGADPKVTNLVPSDITIQRNYFFKPLTWVPLAWTIKNLTELKNARRMLIEGNTFENNWAAAQNGQAINISPINQSNTCNWCTVEDITIRLNKILNVEFGMNMSGRDSPNITATASRLLVENNLLLVKQITVNGSYRIFQMTSPLNGPQNMTIRHNTGLIFINDGAAGFSEMNNGKADLMFFKDNLLSAGQFGFTGTNTAEGNSTLTAFYTNYTFTKNAIIGSQNGAPNYPANNFFPANNAAVGFVNFAGANYRLTSASAYHNAASDGTDVGANIDAIEAAIAGVVGTTYHPVKFALLVTMTSSTPISAGVPVPQFDTFDDCDSAGKAKVNSLVNPVTLREGQKYNYQCLPVQGAANDSTYAKAA